MTKNLAALLCVLILAGFGALAAAEPASSVPSAQPSPAAAPAPAAQLFMSQGACEQTLAGVLTPAPIPTTGCQGGLFGSCDSSFDCKGYFCPIGEIRYCFGGTGSGCEGECGCW